MKPFDDDVRQVIDVEAEHSRTIDGDITELFHAHHDRLVRLAYAITFDAAVAEEVVQDAFLGLHRNAGSVDNAEAYLHRSVVNSAVSVIRRRRIVARHPRAERAPLQASSPEIDEMWTRVQRLPAPQRMVVVLRYWDDMSLMQIADAIDAPLGTVKTWLHRAIATLRKDLS